MINIYTFIIAIYIKLFYKKQPYKRSGFFLAKVLGSLGKIREQHEKVIII